MIHYNDSADRGADCCQVPAVPPDRRSEPGGAEPEEQACAPQQEGDEAGRSVVALELGEGPAFGQRVVDQRHGCQRLHTHHAHSDQAQQTVPRGEVGFTVEVFVVGDGTQAQNCTAAADALQDPVDTAFGLVWKLLDEGAVGREEEDGFCHEEAELKEKEKSIGNLSFIKQIEA